MKDDSQSSMQFTAVAVTGGSGRVGRVVVQALGDSAEVTSVDVAPAPVGVRWREADVTLASNLQDALEGHDAIVHVAALLRSEDPEDRMFLVNALGTWNVLRAARQLGIRRVVIISSEMVSGVIAAMHTPQSKPEYLPVDEAHPLRPRETYAMSKQVAEVVAEGFSRQGDMDVVVLRPTLILMPGWEEYLIQARNTDDRELWSYVMVWDVAKAVQLALMARVGPYNVFYISAADTFSREPTLTFMQRKFGPIDDIRKPHLFAHNAYASIWDISKAQRLLGFVPQHDWRTFLSDGGYDCD